MHFEVCKVKSNAGKKMSHSAGVQAGPDYYDCKCDCGVPPWETCEHSFPLVLEAEYEAMALVADAMRL